MQYVHAYDPVFVHGNLAISLSKRCAPSGHFERLTKYLTVIFQRAYIAEKFILDLSFPYLLQFENLFTGLKMQFVLSSCSYRNACSLVKETVFCIFCSVVINHKSEGLEPSGAQMISFTLLLSLLCSGSKLVNN
jgi:hypothetical protein